MYKSLINKIINKTLIKKDSPKRIFSEIYENNSWKGTESVSGTGSSLEQTKNLRKELSKILHENSIKTILDIPCGDYHWMQYVEMDSIEYLGADIVKPLIMMNRKKYGQNEYRKFVVKNIINDTLPKNDIIVCRDCFVHFTFEEIFKSVRNLKKSKSKYLLATTFTNHILNFDSSKGGWRRLNMQKEPFNFPEPISIINENCTEDNGECSDKSMGLWLICDL